MSPMHLNQIWQSIAWFFALVEFVLALYILFLNAWHTANRHASGLLLLYAVTSYAMGLMVSATNARQADLPARLLAATSPVVQPAALVATVALLKPRWLERRWRWLARLVYVLICAPAVFTLLDTGLGLRLWYTGLQEEMYSGGFVFQSEYAAGSLSVPLRSTTYVAIVLLVATLLYVVLWDRESTGLNRRLAWLLLVTELVGAVFLIGLRGFIGPLVTTLITTTASVVVYAYAAFQQMISERRAQRGRLEVRLTVLVLAITLPTSLWLGTVRMFENSLYIALILGAGLTGVLTFLAIRQAFQPIRTLTAAATAIAAGDLTGATRVDSEDELGILAGAFNDMTVQLREMVSGLEQSVAERTQDLERRSVYLEAAAEVGRAAASVLEPDELMWRVVELIHEQFGLYYVGLFVLDATSEWAVLRAGTGEAGQAMLSRGHQLRMGEGMIGWCIAHAQSRIAQEADLDLARLAAPELPGTRSEAALPLRSRGQVIGALTVQSQHPGAFDEDITTVLQTMADQVAVALDNARLFAENQTALETLQKAYGDTSQQSWAAMMRQRGNQGFRCIRGSLAQAEGDWRPEMLQAVHTEQTVRSAGGSRPALAMPLRVRERVVGVLGFRKDEADERWTEGEIEVLEELVHQLGVALEDAQLYRDAQRRAFQEELLGQISTRMRETLDVESVVRTAVQEIRQALDLPEVVIRLSDRPDSGARSYEQ